MICFLRYFIIQAIALYVIAPTAVLKAETPALSVAEAQHANDRFLQAAQEPGAIIFTPPSGWHVADPNALPPSVKVMVVGKGAHEFPPSINLGAETYAGSLAQYLKRVKQINSSQGFEWKDLGKIRTDAGEGSLSQVDRKTEWGVVRMMHVILKKEGIIYILTASSLKEEFARYYKDFFAAFRSFRFNPQAQGAASADGERH